MPGWMPESGDGVAPIRVSARSSAIMTRSEGEIAAAAQQATHGGQCWEDLPSS